MGRAFWNAERASWSETESPWTESRISVISQNVKSSDKDADADAPFCIVLARYGAVPQVARFGLSESFFTAAAAELIHGREIVVHSDRGPEVARLLEVIHEGVAPSEKPVTGDVLRLATDDDLREHTQNRRRADDEFFEWQSRIDEWELQLQLIDLEWTLEGEQLILYVLNGQDAETTRLALLAAAAGLGIVTVQPVASEGIVYSSGGGGCGSGGCGSGGCS